MNNGEAVKVKSAAKKAVKAKKHTSLKVAAKNWEKRKKLNWLSQRKRRKK